MKKLSKLISLIVLVTVFSGLPAQQFFPIPVDTTSVWRIQREYNNETCVFHFNSIYYINGTEVKNGKEYYKVYEEGHSWESPIGPGESCSGENDYSGVFIGGIRTEEGKTYGYRVYGSPGLLLDFTLNVGDTMFSSICSDGKVIESIDSVLVGNQYRRRFNFENDWYCGWMIEGIGHERGLFESMDDPFEHFSWLICYGENFTPIFGNENCDITVGQKEFNLKNHYVAIHPNPFSTSTTIEYTLEQHKTVRITFYNQFGKQVDIIEENQPKGENKTVWVPEGLPGGIYYFRLKAGEQIMSGKIIYIYQ